MISPRRAMIASNLVAISATAFARGALAGAVGGEPAAQVAAHVHELGDGVAEGVEVARVDGGELAA